MVKCPVPNCNHIAYAITYLHYQQAHQMTMRQVEDQYGTPKPAHRNAEALRALAAERRRESLNPFSSEKRPVQSHMVNGLDRQH